jgi:endonuclease/exonuclease/phosphatase family metal-dependent hydrolase
VSRGLVACSWNIHECVGADGRRDPSRVANVLGEIGADVFALQEVLSDAAGGGELDQARFLAESLGLGSVAGPTLERRGGRYGNLLLTRLPVLSVRRHDLTVHAREPRGALEVVLEGPNEPLRVVVTHLGLRASERARQARLLLDRLSPAAGEILVLLADWNEWLPWRMALRLPRRRFGDVPAPRTFPARRPLLALDRVWVEPRSRLVRTSVHHSRLAARASDHLPLVAWLSARAASSAPPEPRSTRKVGSLAHDRESSAAAPPLPGICGRLLPSAVRHGGCTPRSAP